MKHLAIFCFKLTYKFLYGVENIFVTAAQSTASFGNIFFFHDGVLSIF